MRIKKRNGFPKKKTSKPKDKVVKKKQISKKEISKPKREIVKKKIAQTPAKKQTEGDVTKCPACDEMYIDPPVCFSILIFVLNALDGKFLKKKF